MRDKRLDVRALAKALARPFWARMRPDFDAVVDVIRREIVALPSISEEGAIRAQRLVVDSYWAYMKGGVERGIKFAEYQARLIVHDEIPTLTERLITKKGKR